MMRASEPKLQKKRVLSLDVLRGIAILLVMFHHNTILYTQSGSLAPMTHILYELGWTGVDLFFVLSGFLIGGLLMQEIQSTGSLHVGRFLLRRGFKIWPLYAVFVAAQLLLLGPLSGKTFGFSLHAMLPALVHLQNYFYCPITHLWSLAVEEHFYLLLPMVLWGLLRFTSPAKFSRSLGLVLTLVLIACLVIRCLTLKPPFELYSHRFETHIRIDSLAVGVLLAWVRSFHPAGWSRLIAGRWFMLLLAVAALTPVVFIDAEAHWFGYTFEYTEIYLGYACLLIFALGCGPARLGVITAIARAMAFVGSISYGIYLWHMTADYELARHVFNRLHINSAVTYSAATAINFGACILVGWLATLAIERPFLRLRERLLPSANRLLHTTTMIDAAPPLVSAPAEVATVDP
jgi:peptidoglycan/LPS O-acetylase OafA/YrhL